MLTPRAESVLGLGGRWDVCQVKTSHEKRVAWSLFDSNIDYLIPLQRTRRESGDRLRTRHMPVCPGYVFINTHDVAATRFAIRNDHRGSVLRFIDVHDQAELRRELSTIHIALIENPTLEADQFKPGRKCRVAAGPFVGLNGEIDRTGKRGRVFLKVSLLGEVIPIDIETDLLEPV